MNKRKEILDLGFLTGSVAYGTNTIISDYDICISMNNKAKTLEILRNIWITPSEYNGGIYFQDTDGTKVNCIFVHPAEYLSWMFATQVMTKMLKISSMKKRTKCETFSMLKSLYQLSEIELTPPEEQQNENIKDNR